MNPIQTKLKIEQELSEAYLKDIPHAFFTMDGKDMILKTSQGVKTLKEEKFRELVSSDSMAEVEQFYHSLNVSGHYNTILQLSKDGGNTYSWYEMRYLVGMTVKGEIQTRGLLMNVDRNMKQSKDIEKAHNEEKEARSKEIFLRNLNTEIRSPLNIILGFSELLSNKEFDLTEEEVQNYCQILYTNSRVLMMLVNEILDLSRIESGHHQFQMQECCCEDLLESIYLNWVQQMPEGITLKYSEGRKSIRMMADKSRLTQILNEFMQNAIKYTSQGQIELGWYYSLANRKIEIYVEDTGCGMSEERRKTLLDPTHGMDRMENGMNHLGLAMCQIIAKSMNLGFNIQSQKGRGTRVSILLNEE